MTRQTNTGGWGYAAATAMSALLLGMCAATADAAIIVDFEDLEVGTVFGPGESFETGGVEILIEEGSGRGSPSANVTQSELINSIGNDLRISGGTQLRFSQSADAVSFHFARFGRDGGDALIGIGINAESIADVDLIAASVSIVKVGVFRATTTILSESPLTGMLNLEPINGDFDTLLIRSDVIGHPASIVPLLVDDFVVSVPEPASAFALFIALGFVLTPPRCSRR